MDRAVLILLPDAEVMGLSSICLSVCLFSPCSSLYYPLVCSYELLNYSSLIDAIDICREVEYREHANYSVHLAITICVCYFCDAS